MDVPYFIGDKMPRKRSSKFVWPYSTDTKRRITISRKNKETLYVSGRHTFSPLWKFEVLKMKK
jgi:hypothetical protein